MSNLPEVKIGVVAVSRDCFPESLSVNRRKALMKAYTEKYGADSVYECPVCIVESEIHMVQALEDIKKAGCNALCVYLGNFGPEISETLLAKHFDGPAMFIAAAEETQNDLVGGRGDAYCGMLNASYNLKLRNIKAYIPENPVGTAAECADMLHEFIPIARAIVGLSDLKIISFGPRPLNFLACNAPIKQLYNLGVEIEENSELDLFEAFKKHDGDERIPAKVKEMEAELGAGNHKPEVLPKLAEVDKMLEQMYKMLGCTLTTIPGVNVITAVKILAEIGDIKRFSNANKLAQFAGIAPLHLSSSGKGKDVATKQGNRRLQATIYFLAIQMVQVSSKGTPRNSVVRAYYEKRKAEGKTSQQALICISRRLISIIYGMLKHGTEYRMPVVESAGEK